MLFTKYLHPLGIRGWSRLGAPILAVMLIIADNILFSPKETDERVLLFVAQVCSNQLLDGS